MTNMQSYAAKTARHLRTYNKGLIWPGMTNIRPVLMAACFPLVALAGCANHSENNFTVGSVQSTYKTKHPIVIDEKEKALDVPVPSASYDLPRPAQSAIEGFASEFKTDANGVVTVMVPSGSANEAAARTLAPKVVDVLVSVGIPRRRVRTSSYYASELGASAPIRLSYSALKASVEECGKWPEDLAGPNGENQNYHNFGVRLPKQYGGHDCKSSRSVGPKGHDTDRC